MIKCRECQKEVSSEAKNCPHCGVAHPKKRGLVKSVIFGVIGFFVLYFLVASYYEYSRLTSKNDGGFVMPSVGAQVITYAEYMQTKDGMSYEEVVKIIGAPGREESRNTMPGVPGFSPAITTVMYGWANNNGSNASLMFQNNKLNMKSQFGLK
jgi:uncharacterized membrane protein YeaQ/YmgE (transglycosylase-associated protein family)